jgi:hypothetical protein
MYFPVSRLVLKLAYTASISITTAAMTLSHNLPVLWLTAAVIGVVVLTAWACPSSGEWSMVSGEW